jgi:hypothetical protein
MGSPYVVKNLNYKTPHCALCSPMVHAPSPSQVLSILFSSTPIYNSSLNLRLQEASGETCEAGMSPAPSYLPRVNVYLPEIRIFFQPD